MTPLRRLARATTVLALAGLVATAATVGRGLATDSWPTAEQLLALGLLTHVLALAAVVTGFSATNLRGRPRARRQAGLLAACVGALAAMVAAPSPEVFALGWSASGLAVAGLVATGGTAGAPRAARRTLARLLPADAALWVLVLAGDRLPEPAAIAALLLAVAGRGALVPLGDWLADTAEAPSPVSALLHAGVVNGGVLLLLLHPDVAPTGTRAAVALAALAAVTIVIGALAQQARADVKGRLAASTSTQMALATGLVAVGLPAAALLHVVGHAWWKAWAFLNAGGAVDRARAAVVHERADGARLAAASGAALAGGPTLVLLAAHLPLAVAAVPAALIALVAAVAAREAVLSRSPLALAPVAVVAGLVALAEHLAVPGADVHTPAAGAAAVLLAGMAAALLTQLAQLPGLPLTLVRTRLALPPWALSRARTSLGHRVATAARAEQHHGDGGAPRVRLAVRIASSPVGVAWPLRSAIAVSPEAGLAHLEAAAAGELLDRFHGRDPRDELAGLIIRHGDGTITDVHLRRALADLAADARLPEAWQGIAPQDLVAHTRGLLAARTDGAPVGAVARTLTGAEDVAAGRAPGAAGSLTERAVARSAACCAQAWGRTASRDDDPWRAWLRSARQSGADLVLGIRGVRAAARALPDDPAQALALLHDDARRRADAVGADPLDLFAYLAGLLASAPGWAAHARWRAEHAGASDAVVALCAVLAAHDVLLSRVGEDAAAPVAPASADDGERREARHLIAVWQRALDLAAGERLLAAGTRPAPVLEQGRSVVHSLWCLDARSAPMRRHLDALPGPRRHRTHGVAGFFGVALDVVDPDGTRTLRAPGLLTADLHRPASTPRAGAGWTTSAAGRSTVAALGYAEVGGLLALGEVVTSGLRRLLGVAPGRAARRATLAVDTAPVVDDAGVELPASGKAARVAAILRGAGIADDLGAVLLVVGHGASTANNAYAAAYDCGACGANPGVLNAAVLAAWFNDPEVRAELAALGIAVPARATAVHAWHDTTADVATLASDHPDVLALQRDLDAAGARARAERALDLPGAQPMLRGADIAEAMPEWGLAGAQGLLIGSGRIPDPGARWFQLDVPEDADDTTRAALLRDALAGPGLVAAGIMACYSGSVAHPGLFGAGDKTTHNVVGDVGVVRGRAGDLAIGLPWQALSPADPALDPTAPRHLPARPVIAVEAPREQVLAAVREVEDLHRLVVHRWVTLWAVESMAGALRPAVAEYAPGRGWLDLATGAPLAEAEDSLVR